MYHSRQAVDNELLEPYDAHGKGFMTRIAWRACRLALVSAVLTLSLAGRGAAADTISGTITIDPKLTRLVAPTDVLFITARVPAPGGAPGRMLAAKRMDALTFPLTYTLTPQDVMMGGAFQGKVNIIARIKKSGSAGPPEPGDLEGQYAKNPATVGDQHADIVINKRY